MEDKIIIKGARQHNLKNINLTIPKNKLVVFTGLSGSGKSSLAFDTLYAEGQRRYVESLSSYARQFLGIMDKPEVDSIEGLSPAISIDQKSNSHNPRSTIGTVTEIYDYLRLLYAKIGHPHCPNCLTEITRMSKEQITDNIKNGLGLKLKSQKQIRFIILAPIVKDKRGEYIQLFHNLKTKGYAKVRIDKNIYDLNNIPILIKTNKHSIEAVIDRVTLNKKDELSSGRIPSDIEAALNLSDGEVIICEVNDKGFSFPETPKNFRDYLYSEKNSCLKCGTSINEIEPRTFSFNSPHGACSRCDGIGSLLKVDPNLIVAPSLTIDEGAIVPFAKNFEYDTWYSRIVRQVCLDNGINTKISWQQLSEKEIFLIMYGTGDKIYEVYGNNRQGRETVIHETFIGIVNELEKKYKETDSDFARMEIEKYLREEICPDCQGARLKKEARLVTINKISLPQLTQKTITETLPWIESLEKQDILSPKEVTISQTIIKEIITRLTFLYNVGLDYLSLNRTTKTLSGGEAQRIRLASQIGTGLSGVLYVLDEPSIGLHQKDNKKLIETLKRLRDLGNSVVVVEHDRETMDNADLIVDFGPGAGKNGGYIIFTGTPEEIRRSQKSSTGLYLSNKRKISVLPEEKSQLSLNNLTIVNASEHNLKNIDVNFPLGKFICITGVSGSGKSTLINDILYQALAGHLNPYHRINPGRFDHLEGEENIKRVVMVDQSPIGRTPRSNPATYTGCFNLIRDIFAQTKEAKMRGYDRGRFSFNVRGGRCETCQGEGQIKIEMQFLPDVYVKCESCQGKRYNTETLEIAYQDRNISEILNLTVDEATEIFSHFRLLNNKLATLQDVGLGYIQLGQPATQLSGGEAQRIKLATELSKNSRNSSLYLLDEPTTGLHFADLEKLLYVLKKLVSNGNTVIVIEHNLDIIKNADWIIDLGPNGGNSGGYIVAEGSPQDIARCKTSYTGQFLRDILKI